MFFDEVFFWFYDVRLAYHDLDGEIHGTGYDYWPTHWIFISGVKNQQRDIQKKANLLKSIWNKRNAEYNVFDRNSLIFKFYQTSKNIARKSKLYVPLKKYIKAKFTKFFA